MTYQPHRITPARASFITRLFWLGADDSIETPHEPVTARKHPSDFDRFSARHGALIDGVCDFLARARLDPAPAHYELAWHYLTSACATERFRIETHLLEQGQIAPGDAEVLLSEMRPTIRTHDLDLMIEQARASISDARASTDQSGRDAAEYGAALTTGIAALDSPASVRVATAHLRQLTQDMVTRVARAENDLKAQSLAMGKLRSKLAHSQKEALSDPLTGLPNRRAFERRLKDAITNARSAGRVTTIRTLSVGFCDIDHFKAVNDSHGHATGDRIIRYIADMLAAMAGGGCHVARHGGDEFAVLFEGDGAETASAKLDDIRMALGEKHLVAQDSGEDIGPISFSGGIAVLLDGDTPSSLLARADRALYQAKSSGRGRVDIG